MSELNVKNKKVTIMGLGLNGGGVGAARFFANAGAKVLVADLKTEKELRDSLRQLKGLSVRYVLGRHRPKDFINADLVIKNPAVPDESRPLALARKHGVPVETDVGIFFDLCSAPIIGVTGTKGKSTTAALIFKMLRTKYRNAVLAGLPSLLSVFDVLSKLKEGSLVILELSSFQLEGLAQKKKSPHIAVITNVFSDHLNRHKTFARYVSAKANIFKFQKPDDFLVIPKSDALVEKMTARAQSKKIYFSRHHDSFLANVAAAKAVAKLLGASKQDISRAIKDFKPLSGRLEEIGVIRGVKYINDTCATNPGAAIASIATTRERICSRGGRLILIAGGEDKKLNYSLFAQNILNNVDVLILLPGSATEKIKRELQRRSPVGVKLQFILEAATVKKAVETARRFAQKGDAVLLSPAAASFNLFQNEFDRGEQFVKAARKRN